LGFATPQYAHIPMILAPDRSKLSKRKGTVSIRDYKELGYLPEAIVNFIALLGWNPGTDQEIFSMDELIEQFDLQRVQKSGAVFNIDKLNSLNGHYIRAKSDEEYLKVARPFLSTLTLPSPIKGEGKRKAPSPLVGEGWGEGYINQVLLLFKDRVKILSELPELTSYFFRDDLQISKELLIGKAEAAKTLEMLKSALEVLSGLKDFSAEKIEKELRALAEKLKVKAGELFVPIRNAVSGRSETPPLFAMLEVLGKARVESRLSKAINILK
jgi:glutamyl-tRNA synthetase